MLRVAAAVSMVMAMSVFTFTTGAPVAHAVPAIQSVNYVVFPHPDDEYEAWSKVQQLVPTGTYTVFILLTHGEATGNCANGNLVPGTIDPGEIPPPIVNGVPLGCHVDRLTPHLQVMAGQVALTPGISPMLPSSPLSQLASGYGCSPNSETFLHFAGETSAEFIFDIGDGRVTPACVKYAVQTTRYAVQSIFSAAYSLGDIDDSVIGAAYYNTDPTCFPYTHPDHKAVYDAITTMDLGVPHQLTATCGSTYGGASTTGGIPDVNWTGNMAVQVTNGVGVAVGNMQRFYGWLFPGFIDYGPQTGFDLNGGPTVAMQKNQKFAVLR